MLKQKKPIRVNNKKKRNKPWFSETCRTKRKQFIKGRRRAMNNKSNVMLFIESKRLAREYKTSVRKSYKKYKDDLAKSLRNLLCNNPKAYWNILN